MTPLATPEDLGLILKESIDPADLSALLILDIASGMVRDTLDTQGYALDAVADDVVVLDPINGVCVFLPGLPVTAVSLVETFDGAAWVTADPATYSVSKRLGVISAVPWTGASWPAGSESWRVTYDHGFAALPSSILGVVLGVAARAWTNPGEVVAAETVGPFQVKYQMESDGFSAIERKAMARYANPRIA